MKIQYPAQNDCYSPPTTCLSTQEAQKIYGIAAPVCMSLNEQAWGASPKVVRALRSHLQTQNRYPNTSNERLLSLLAQKNGVQETEILLSNGSREVFDLLIRTFIDQGDEVITSCLSVTSYLKYVDLQKGLVLTVPLANYSHDLTSIQNLISEKTRLIVLDNPINPTGRAINLGELYLFLSKIPENILVVLDEVYADFMDNEFRIDTFSLIRNTEKRCAIVVLRTFSLLYGLAGLRLGYGIMPNELCHFLRQMQKPYSINQMASAAAIAALEDHKYYNEILKKTIENRDRLIAAIEGYGCSCQASQTNFICVDIGGDADLFFKCMLNKGFLVYSLKEYGMPSSLRISLGTDEENDAFLKAFYLSLQENRNA